MTNVQGCMALPEYSEARPCVESLLDRIRDSAKNMSLIFTRTAFVYPLIASDCLSHAIPVSGHYGTINILNHVA